MLYKALAGSVGMRLFNVGESDGRGQELTCHELLGELRLAQKRNPRNPHYFSVIRTQFSHDNFAINPANGHISTL